MKPKKIKQRQFPWQMHLRQPVERTNHVLLKQQKGISPWLQVTSVQLERWAISLEWRNVFCPKLNKISEKLNLKKISFCGGQTLVDVFSTQRGPNIKKTKTVIGADKWGERWAEAQSLFWYRRHPVTSTLLVCFTTYNLYLRNPSAVFM